MCSLTYTGVCGAVDSLICFPCTAVQIYELLYVYILFCFSFFLLLICNYIVVQLSELKFRSINVFLHKVCFEVQRTNTDLLQLYLCHNLATDRAGGKVTTSLKLKTQSIAFVIHKVIKTKLT